MAQTIKTLDATQTAGLKAITASTQPAKKPAKFPIPSHNILLTINIVLSILIVIFILVQGRGGGMGSAWGGGGETFHTRRGIERVTIRVTVILICIFFALSALNLFIRP